MRVSDYIIEYIYKSGVNHIFQVTGRGSLFLNDAVAKHKLIKGISLHHEQACSFASIAYAEKTNNIGVCLVSTGCASTNALTGTLCAWQDGIPCLYISGQNILKDTTNFSGLDLRTYGQQEFNISNLVKPITKFSEMLKEPMQIHYLLEKAIKLATTGRKGPCWLDIPLDLQSALIDPIEVQKHRFEPKEIFYLNRNEVDFVVDSINNSKRPVILIGKGIKYANATELLINFIEDNSIPLVFSSSAPDIYGSANFLSIGSVGSMGCSRAGNFAIQNSDLLIVIGSRLSSLTTGEDYCKFAREAKKIVVDIDKTEHEKPGILIDKFIHSDAKKFLEKLNKIKFNKDFSIWVKKCIHWKKTFSKVERFFNSDEKIDLYELSNVLSKILPDDSTLVTDSGLIEVILPSNISFKTGVNCIHSSSQGSMGFALPASIGIQKSTSKLVVAVIGDGSIMMNLQELESIKYLNLPIKIIVINNNLYSIIRRRQKDLFRRRTIGTDPDNGISCPEFRDIANCFNMDYLKVEKVKDLKSSLIKVFESEGSFLCEIIGKTDQDYIEISHAKSELTGKLIKRPLEDQKPFLDRELFKKEMLIKPIDL